MTHRLRTCEFVVRVALSICGIELITGCASDHREVADGSGVPNDRLQDGQWSVFVTASAAKGSVTGVATFDGPAGQTRRMGICLVRRHVSAAGGAACLTADDCDSLSSSLPPGAHLYCLRPAPPEAGHCHYRPGPPQAFCAGSPAQALSPIPPGTYRVEVMAPAGSEWRATACFEGCSALPPATSADVTVP